MTEDLTPAVWHKSTYSSDIGICVEVADLADGHRAVRDSKNPTGPVLTVLPTQWAAFTAGIRNGDFD